MEKQTRIRKLNKLFASIGAKYKVIEKKHVSGFPNDYTDTKTRFSYKYKFQRGKKSFCITFYDSVYNYEHNKKPSVLDVVYCLVSDNPYSDIYEFCEEYGYNKDAEYEDAREWKRIKAIYNAVKKQYNNYIRLFEDVEEEIQNIMLDY